MKRFTQYVAVAALMMVPAMVSAQSSTVRFGVSGGLSVPTGDLADDVDAGYSIAGHLFLKPSSMESVRFRGDVSYDRFAYKGDIDGNRSNLGFVGNVLIDLTTDGGVQPYLLGGLGAFNGKNSRTGGSVDRSTSSTDFGIQLGGGLTFELSGFSTFIEAKYVNVFTNNTNTAYLPITFGIRF